MTEYEISLVDHLKSTKEGRRRFAQERAVVKVTDQIQAAMEEKGVNRSKLAKLLGRTKGWVTQLLDGESNKTIRTVADVFAVLDMQLETSYTPLLTQESSSLTEGLKFEFTFSPPTETWSTVSGKEQWSPQQIEGLPRRFDSLALDNVVS